MSGNATRSLESDGGLEKTRSISQLRSSQSELQLLSEVKEEPDEGGSFFNFSLMCEET